MQAGAYDTVLILFYFFLSFSLSFTLSVTFAQPLFLQRLPMCIPVTSLPDAYQQTSWIIISYYYYTYSRLNLC